MHDEAEPIQLNLATTISKEKVPVPDSQATKDEMRPTDESDSEIVSVFCEYDGCGLNEESHR